MGSRKWNLTQEESEKNPQDGLYSKPTGQSVQTGAKEQSSVRGSSKERKKQDLTDYSNAVRGFFPHFLENNFRIN